MPTRLTQTGAEVQEDLYKIEDIDLATEEKAGLMSPADKAKLDNIEGEIPTKLSDLEDDATHRLVTDTEKRTWNNKSDFSGYYDDLVGRPYIPRRTSDLTNDSGFITKAVNDLVNYYLKSEVYTKAEVDQIVSTVGGFTIRVVDTLPTASEETMKALYLVPSADPEAGNVKDEWITIENTGTYSWERIGSTAIDLDGYVTDDELTAALQGYVTSTAFTTALAGKQDVIQDLESIRAGATAGATAYQKPQSGIPASDLAEAVRTSLGKADTALQSESDPTVPAWAKEANPPTEIFKVEYQSATFSEVRAALQAGKIIFLYGCEDTPGMYYNCILAQYDLFVFCAFDADGHIAYYVTLDDTNDWNSGNWTVPTQSAVNSKYTKPSSGIPASDLSQTVRNALDLVQFVTYGSDTYNRVEHIITNGNIAACYYQNRLYFATAKDVNFHAFIFSSAANGENIYKFTLASNDAWSGVTSVWLEDQYNRSNEITDSQQYYPTNYAVYTALATKVSTDSHFNESDWDYILAEPVPPLPFYIFTEDFQEYDPDDYAQDNGYNDWTNMASAIAAEPELLQYTGAQMFADTGDTIEYDGETYHLFQMHTDHDENDNWAPVEGLYGLVSGDTTLAFLQSKIPQQAGDILNDPYVPIVAVADQDNNIYSDNPGMVYTLIYAMARTI